MRGAHITLVTSSIRFAGGRIEVGPWLSLADSSGFAFGCYASPLHSNLANNLFACSWDNRRPGDGVSTTTMGMSMNDDDGALAVIIVGQWVTVSLLANG
jgi:hypothetical protein